jgi:hypothetical protein
LFFAIFALAGAGTLYLGLARTSGGGFGPQLLVPLIFLIVGVGGMVWAWRAAKAKPGATGLAAAASPFGVAPPPGAESAAIELKPTATPLGKLIAVTLFALFWNGIVSVFVVHVYRGWGTGNADGCATLFLIPFVLIGLAALFMAGQQFLILFNPRVRLTLAPGVLMTGGLAYLQWRLTGRGGGVSRLRIVLEGREEARYRRGTNTYTDREVFARVPIVDTAQAFEIPAGNARIDVPAGGVPSFTAEHNKIVWSLKVTCEIPRWPDSEDEYEVLVRPMPIGGGL